MTDQQSPLGPLRRPALLIRAARAGLPLYRRGRDLRRLLGRIEAPAPGLALDDLLDAEAAHEGRRLGGDPAYDPARHVEMLIALLAEARLAAPPPATAGADTLPDPAHPRPVLVMASHRSQPHHTKARSGPAHIRGAA